MKKLFDFCMTNQYLNVRLSLSKTLRKCQSHFDKLSEKSMFLIGNDEIFIVFYYYPYFTWIKTIGFKKLANPLE